MPSKKANVAAGKKADSKERRGRRKRYGPQNEEERNKAVESLCDYLNRGLFMHQACSLAGLSSRVTRDWMERARADAKVGESSWYTDFSDKVASALVGPELASIEAIRGAVTKDGEVQWQAHAWYLERKHAERWGRKSPEVAVVKEVQQASDEDVSARLMEAAKSMLTEEQKKKLAQELMGAEEDA